MCYYELDPEVPGRLSEDSLEDLVNGRQLDSINYIMESPVYDDLIQYDPVFLVSERLAAAMTASGLSGYNLKECILTKDDQMQILYTNMGDILPFKWLDIVGIPGQDDIGMSSSFLLVASSRSLGIFRRFKMDGCRVQVY